MYKRTPAEAIIGPFKCPERVSSPIVREPCVVSVSAWLQGAFASRMSHSCTPNCQAVVMACAGRLTIAVYTLRYVQAGEELTFDYSSVTESEKEFRCRQLCSRVQDQSLLYWPLSRGIAANTVRI